LFAFFRGKNTILLSSKTSIHFTIFSHVTDFFFVAADVLLLGFKVYPAEAATTVASFSSEKGGQDKKV
jgi:hypothetical protein